MQLEFPHELTSAVEARINQLPVAKHLGLRAEISADGMATARIEQILAHHLGGHADGSGLNGAAILNMLYCAIIGTSLAHAQGSECTTLELNVRLSHVVEPREVRAVGYVVSQTRQLIFANAAVFDWRPQPRILATGIVMRRRADR